MKPRGKFITLEGPEGCGKSTHTRLLVAQLQAASHSVIATREPGGTHVGEVVRRLLQYDEGGEGMAAETEIFLFMASRAQLVRQIIAPALADGACVVCDRFADSTTAYQGYARGCDVEKILLLNDLAAGGLAPDLTVLLDVDVKTGFERLHHRNLRQGADKDRIEREELSFHERVRLGYLELALRWPERIKVVDAARDEDTVQADIWELVKHAIGT